VSGAAIQKGVSKSRIVAIAASTGGPQAIHAILSHLPAAFPVPVIIPSTLLKDSLRAWWTG